MCACVKQPLITSDSVNLICNTLKIIVYTGEFTGDSMCSEDTSHDLSTQPPPTLL